METWSRELRYALRHLRHRPALTVTATLTLALGLGTAIAIFAVVYATLEAPLPLADEQSLVRVWKRDPARDFDHYPVLFQELATWREENRSFGSLSAITHEGTWALTLVDAGFPETLRVAPVSWSFFETLGVPVLRGRAFTAEDEQSGEPRPVILSHRTWVLRFAQDPQVVGRILRLDGQAHEVVGVAPPSLDYPSGSEIWRCLAAGTRAELEGLGRLRPGVGLEGARREIEELSERYHASSPPALQGKTAVAVPLRETLVGQLRRPLLLLLGAAGLFLVIAWGNVANLLALEAAARRRQLAVRMALGATRGRTAAGLFAESALLSLGGGLLGTLLAAGVLAFLRDLGPHALGSFGELTLGPEAAAVAAGLTLLTALACGLAATLHGLRTSTADRLHERADGRAGTTALTRWLVAGQLALAVILLIGAGLLVRTFAEHLRLDRGFDTHRLLSVHLRLPSGERGLEPVRRLHGELLPRLEALPGVDAASVVLNRPLAQSDGYDALIQLEGQSGDEAQGNPWVSLEAVSTGYLRAFGAPLLAGRFFSAEDRADSPPVVVVNRSLAERYWPSPEGTGEQDLGRRALGRRLRLFAPDEPWLTVVGVIGDLRYRDLTEMRQDLLVPFAQSRWAPVRLVLRTASEPGSVAVDVRREIQRLAPHAAVDVAPLDELLAEGVAPLRSRSLLAATLATLALLLAAVGIYGVMAALVGERRPEIGVRMALGATRRQVTSMILAQGLSLAGAGLLVGLAGARMGAGLLDSLLFRVSSTDPWTYATLALLTLTVAGVGIAIPARRAAREDPARVLRSL